MQSELSATLPHLNANSPQQQDTPSQHGSPQQHALAAGHLGRNVEQRSQCWLTYPIAAARPDAPLPADSAMAVDEQLQRLSLLDTEHGHPAVSALLPSPPQQQSEGPEFKVVKKTGHSSDRIRLDQFPNGMATSYAPQL